MVALVVSTVVSVVVSSVVDSVVSSFDSIVVSVASVIRLSFADSVFAHPEKARTNTSNMVSVFFIEITLFHYLVLDYRA